MHEIQFTVQGFPPIKNEAKSTLAAGLGDAPRVLMLLRAAVEAAGDATQPVFPVGPLGPELSLTVIYTRSGDLPSATSTSVLHYRDIVARPSPVVYAAEVVGMSDQEQVQAVLADSYIVSRVLVTKADGIASAVR